MAVDQPGNGRPTIVSGQRDGTILLSAAQATGHELKGILRVLKNPRQTPDLATVGMAVATAVLTMSKVLGGAGPPYSLTDLDLLVLFFAGLSGFVSLYRCVRDHFKPDQDNKDAQDYVRELMAVEERRAAEERMRAASTRPDLLPASSSPTVLELGQAATQSDRQSTTVDP